MELPNGNVIFDKLKVGDLINIDMDCFMLGDAQCVVSITNDEIQCELYHMGVRFPCKSYDALIKKKNIENWWTRGETLKQWQTRLYKKQK